jgi:glycosyltransferase involved in cell wall biosynthesis
MVLPISVVIPVGPQEAYKDYLEECIQSVYENDPAEVIVIDDLANLGPRWKQKHSEIQYYRNDWLTGCSDSWNRGVARAENELVFLMGSDDKFTSPHCLEACVNAYETNNYLDAWYNVTCITQSGEIVSAFNNAAAVTRGLWQLLGGFGPSAFAAPDAWAVSIMMVHMSERLIQVEKDVPHYWVREHSEQDTPRQFGRFFEAAHSIRNIATRDWVPPTWKGWE